MEYKEQYMNIFAYARVLLGDDLNENVKFILRSINIGHQISIDYLKMVADNLTAFNEICPYSHFLHARFFASL